MSEFIRIKIGEVDRVAPKSSCRDTFKQIEELMIMMEDSPDDILITAVDNYYRYVKHFEGIVEEPYGI